MTPAEPAPPLPVTIVGGYLGAGKTTLVNHLLRHADGLRIAVLVNDFGDLPIDADLIESADGDVIALAGGCVCCAFGSDLVGALIALARRAPRPDHVLIETSGVALPGAVARTLTLVAGLERQGVLVVVDAQRARPRRRPLRRRHRAPPARRGRPAGAQQGRPRRRRHAPRVARSGSGAPRRGRA